VRGILRSLDREAELRQTLAKFVYADNRLNFTEADLLYDEGWLKAASDCAYVLPLASPFPLHMLEDEGEDY